MAKVVHAQTTFGKLRKDNPTDSPADWIWEDKIQVVYSCTYKVIRDPHLGLNVQMAQASKNAASRYFSQQHPEYKDHRVYTVLKDSRAWFTVLKKEEDEPSGNS